MRSVPRFALSMLVLAGTLVPGGPLGAQSELPLDGVGEAAAEPGPVESVVRRRVAADRDALAQFRPGYAFWQHVFEIPDGSVVFGSAQDGRLLVTVPARGDWSRDARWTDEGLAASISSDPSLPARLSDRRDRLAELLEPAAGPVLHNPTRGDFVIPNIDRYGGFLDEWGRIYERFGVPAEIGLAQAVVESGFSGDIKSEARAIGFCQWLPRNWERLQRLMPHAIEVENQTTQAAFCAAHLSVLATKYGSFLPALSAHHAGGANVGRTVINGARLGAGGIRERYLVGADLAVELRSLSPRTFRELVGTYGPRSYRYAEMVFGNASTVERIRARVAQESIYAVRVSRALSFDDIVRATGLSRAEVSRFNPALVRRVPAGASLYLPKPVKGLGEDVSFWHRDAPADYDRVLGDFLALDEPLEVWESPAFERVLQEYRRRFRATDSEEGLVMAAMLGYIIQELPQERRILARFRADPEVEQLFQRGVELRDSVAR